MLMSRQQWEAPHWVRRAMRIARLYAITMAIPYRIVWIYARRYVTDPWAHLAGLCSGSAAAWGLAAYRRR